MNVRTYRDLVLVLGDVVPEIGPLQSFTVHVFDSPAGQAEKKDRVTVPDPQQLDRWLVGLSSGTLNAEDQKRLGTLLGDLLLPTSGAGVSTRQLFRESYLALRDGEALRIRVRAPGWLAELPWEFIYLTGVGGRPDFLLFDPKVSLVRHDAFVGAVPGDVHPPPARRRIVYAISNPKGGNLNSLTALPGERRAVREALSGRPDLDVVYLPAGPDPTTADFQGATANDLANAFLGHRTDVFHFSGHGEFRRGKSGGGSLILADETNAPVPLPAKNLGGFLGAGLRLVVLGACNTADQDARNPWGGVAETLLGAGVPAVVAMQFPVADGLAAAFCGAFYRAIAAGWLIDAAVTAGRLAMRAKAIATQTTAHDWVCPVLHLRSATGLLFNPTPGKEAAARAEEFTRAYKMDINAVATSATVVGALGESGVTVEQEVRDVGGVLVGLVDGQGNVVMKLGTVTGLVIGGMNIGGRDVGSALAELRKRLLAQDEPEDGQ